MSAIPVEWKWEDFAIMLELKDNWNSKQIIIAADDYDTARDITNCLPMFETIVAYIQKSLDEYSSKRDDLTGLYRRNKFLEKVKWRVWTIIIFDIDDFKSVNDTFWHPVWDKVIRQVASIITNNVKAESDVVCRRWGEEFIAFISNYDESLVKSIFERIQSDLKKWKCKELKLEKITVSAWAAIYTWQDKIEETIKEADNFLYEAKKNWKNRIMFWSARCDLTA